MSWTPLPETRHSLLARLEDPDDFSAWEEFIDIYEKAIWRYCRSRGLHSDEGLEVAQQVWLVVFQQVRHWRTNTPQCSFRAWLFETARRISLKSLRDRQRWRGIHVDPQSPPSMESCSPESDQVDEAEWQRWAFAWASSLVEAEVSETTWSAFVRTALENQDPAQVAFDLHLQIGAVYTAKCRVLARIRAHIHELSPSSSTEGSTT